MIPLRDVQRTRGVPIVVIAIIAANLIVYLYQLSLGSGAEQLFERYGLIPAKLCSIATYARGGVLAALTPLLTSMFLHGGFLHIGFNMWFLWIFGDNIEHRLGSARFLFFYLICGIVAGFGQAIMIPRSTVPTIGASGAISGVLGGYLLLFPTARIVTLVPIFIFLTAIQVPAFIFLGLWFALQFLSGMASVGMPKAMGGTAWFAHVGGFLSGIALVKFLDRKPRRRDHRVLDEEDYS
jgi:membrane associated rhomboid family serine protease